MPKYWGIHYFAHGSFLEVGQKQKTEGEKKRKKERLNDGNNNGKLRIAISECYKHENLFSDQLTCYCF